MITGILGSSPVSSVTKAGRSEFVSLLRPKPSKAYGEDAGREFRPYVNTRGIIIDKNNLSGETLDLTKGYQFQFNPRQIEDNREVSYEGRPYVGLPYQDYVWTGGGSRTISFQLFLDDTPQSHISSFRPTATGRKLASDIKSDSKFSNGPQANGFEQEIDAQKRTYKPKEGPAKLEYNEYGAHSHSRMRERGILDDVELIQSFMYPAPLAGESTPKFAEGGVVSMNQFRPPATVVVCIGPLYLEGYVKSAPVTYTLFDSDLCPIRATIDISFIVLEYSNVNRKIPWNKK